MKQNFLKGLRTIVDTGVKARETSNGIRRKVSAVFFGVDDNDNITIPTLKDYSVNRLPCGCSHSALEVTKDGSTLTLVEANAIAKRYGMDALISRGDVQHAEIGALSSHATNTFSESHSKYGLYVSATPCIVCARTICNSPYTGRLHYLVFSELYRDLEGLNFIISNYTDIKVLVDNKDEGLIEVQGETPEEMVEFISQMLVNGGASGM